MQQTTYQPNSDWFVASLVVQARPAQLVTVREQILAMPNTEIYAEKTEEGKLVVIVEANMERDLVEKMERLQTFDGVMAVSLIYSQRDIQEN